MPAASRTSLTALALALALPSAQAQDRAEVADSPVTGPVLETMQAAGYTYVRVPDGTGEVWAACWETAVATGQVVTVPAGYVMRGFRSPTLQRTFDAVRFVPALGLGTNAVAPRNPAQLPPGHPRVETNAGNNVVWSFPAKIDPPPGGLSIADLRTHAKEWVGRDVLIRGRVVKYTQQVLDRNWLHLQDGSSDAPEACDITITTAGTTDLGRVVSVRGRLSANRDFGYGYAYDLLVEDARIEP